MNKTTNNTLIIVFVVLSILFIPIATIGFAWFVLDIISIITGCGGNLTGLGLIIGSVSAGIGFLPTIVLTGLLCNRSIKLSNDDVKHVITTKVIKIFSFVFVIIIIVIALVMGAWTNYSWNKKVKGYEEKRAKTEQKYIKEAEEISKLFEDNETLVISFSLTYRHDRKYADYTANMSVSERGAAHKEFVLENIIEPIDRQYIFYLDDCGSSLEYVVEITKEGYDKLKNNEYVHWISLVK